MLKFKRNDQRFGVTTWELEKDWGPIMRKIIMILELAIIIALIFVLFTEEKAEAIEEPEARYFLMEATAYYPGPECCDPWANWKTYTGDDAGKGSIAIDPKNGPLKLGQKIFVEGYGYGICNDIGGAIKEWKIDLCYDTLEEAKEWGRKLVKVYLVEGEIYGQR